MTGDRFVFSLRNHRLILLGRAAAVALCTAGVVCSSSNDLPAGERVQSQSLARFRGPVALVLVNDGKSLLVANRRSGSISIVDTEARRVTGEFPIGKRLSALVAVCGGDFVLATDEEAHELILIARQGEALNVVARLQVEQYPVSVVSSPDGARSYVASLWSHRLSIVDVETAGGENQPVRLKLAQVVSLPFAPRRQLLVDETRRLVVADAFGGYIAVIDARSGAVEAVRELPAHNIQGLALTADGDRLLVAHQVLNSLARTTPDDVHWGMLMGNVVRSLKLGNVLDKDVDVLRRSQAHPVGGAGNAAADPAGLALLANGHMAVALAGVGEIGFFPEDDSVFRRVSLGGRPTEIVAGPNGNLVYAADELGDTISVVDVGEARRIGQIALGPQPELSLADRGERLFYDGRLAHDGWMSCHSCHTVGHSNGLLNDNLGDDSFGAPKRVPSLLGAGRTRPWAWNGQIAELEEQIKKSIETTMRGRTPRDETVAALAAFVKTLPAAPPLRPNRGGDEGAIGRGERVFTARHCERCHAPPEYTSETTYDVGLKDELGRSRFNPPSLRGVSQRQKLFHDNRAGSLDEVFTRFKHQSGDELGERDLADLVAFLQSL